MPSETPDNGLIALRALMPEFAKWESEYLSEADTRAKLIDRLLREVLFWPEDAVRREQHGPAGFMDYSLTVHGRRFAVIEAKKTGIGFTLPIAPPNTVRSYKLNGALVTDDAIKQVIEQVHSYASEEGIRYSVVTNGASWIVFRSVREDCPWRQGYARVFPDLNFIENHFTEFWNTLSFEAVSAGSLDDLFGAADRVSREMHRVTSRLFNADLPLRRNHLHAQLAPVIDTFFTDIGDKDEIEILKRCYVHSLSLRIVARDLNVVISDALPRFLSDEGAQTVFQGSNDSGVFGRVVEEAVSNTSDRPPQTPSSDSHIFLILGGIGSGKTTFLKRYQRTVGKTLLERNALWFHIDLLGPPDRSDLEHYVWSFILDDIRSRYAGKKLEKRDVLKRVYADRITALKETTLRGMQPGSDQYEDTLSECIESWRKDLADYVPRLVRYARVKHSLKPFFFVDNVDQLPPAFQAQVFMFAQRLADETEAIAIFALREESYYSASVQKIFTAYTTQKFHIASPQFKKLLGNRILYAKEVIRDEAKRRILKSSVPIDTDGITDLLSIVERSIFSKNHNIARFIEAVCFGNMRNALQMFATFLTSGATDVDKMLRIFRREGGYYIAFHEFVKSVMLGDRKYYKESESPILNLFETGSEPNSSHFTSVRLLNILLAHRGDRSREGQGYVGIERIANVFEGYFDNRRDFIKSLERMVARQLVELNTRSLETIADATEMRVTAAGWYFVRHLMHRFAYLDLVLQDTPLDDSGTEKALRESVFEVDNLSDPESEKLPRVKARFRRVHLFLDYLAEEEKKEVVRYGLDQIKSPVAELVVDNIRERLNREEAYILRRIQDNRDKYAEEPEYVALDTGSVQSTEEEFVQELLSREEDHDDDNIHVGDDGAGDDE